MMNLGEVNTLKVIRKSDLGYMITDGSKEVLLHFREANKELDEEEEVDVFLYYDKKGRLTASMNQPYVTLSKPGFVKVVEIFGDTGVFVDINCGKDILISKDYLPYDTNRWPDVDDELLVSLKLKKDAILAKPLNKFEINELKSDDSNYSLDEKVEGIVCRIAENGVSFVTKTLGYIYVNQTQLRKNYRLGEKETIKITKIKEDEYIGTINEQKEKLIDSDAEFIIDYLKKHNDKMKITAKSSSEEILKEFKMSRKAFKRALGNLYKEQTVEFDEEYTYLIKK